jgi:Raf kinase inhibitor-like YbhB/YbcL family protein
MSVKLRAKICGLLALALLSCACHGKTGSSVNQGNAPQPAETAGAKKSGIRLTSRAFNEGGAIPKQYTCDGANQSPPLAWDSVPQGTQTLALIAEDPDAPARVWAHWVVFSIPAAARELPENLAPQITLPTGGQQGTNDFRKIGYGGPCPPVGQEHRYYFKLYALDIVTLFEQPPNREQLQRAIQGHILAEGELMGRYKRQ